MKKIFTFLLILLINQSLADGSNDDLVNEPLENNYDNKVKASDPLEPINRVVFSFNRVIDFLLLEPIATAYDSFVFDPVKQGVSGVLNNLAIPITFVNDVLSGEPKNSLKSVARFIINSTIGVLGIFDPASKLFDIKPHKNTFGDTLVKWGMGHGPYLVLPLLGPSSVIGVIDYLLGYFSHPYNRYMWNTNRDAYVNLYSTIKGIETRRNFLVITQELYDTPDPYSSFRLAYLQNKGIIDYEESFVPDDIS